MPVFNAGVNFERTNYESERPEWDNRCACKDNCLQHSGVFQSDLLYSSSRELLSAIQLARRP